MAWGLETNIRGPAGPTGPVGAASTVPGPQGPAGATGQGVPTGGATGQVLTKTSATDYATNWQTPSGGGASVTIGDSPPGSPTVGSLWFESGTGNLYIFYDDGTSSQWVPATASVAAVPDEVVNGIITIASTAPSSPAVGDVWIDTT